jgi:hypothetical protein
MKLKSEIWSHNTSVRIYGMFKYLLVLLLHYNVQIIQSLSIVNINGHLVGTLHFRATICFIPTGRHLSGAYALLDLRYVVSERAQVCVFKCMLTIIRICN